MEIAFVGQTLTHCPQAMHNFGSTTNVIIALTGESVRIASPNANMIMYFLALFCTSLKIII